MGEDLLAQMQDHGLLILHHGLCHCSDIIINEFWLSYNNLTTQSASLISELTVKCKVKVLGITGNHTIGENQQLYSTLVDPSNILVQLYMMNTNLSSRAATALFTAVKDNITLKKLYIAYNDITDDAITAALERNSCLVYITIH